MKKIIFCLIFFGLFFLAAKSVLAIATFSLNPASGTINIEEATQVDIVLDTGGDLTGAISVILTFNAAKLSAGSSVTPGVFALELVNTVDNTNGVIRFDAGTSTNQNGSNVTVATINFSGKTSGTAEVSFTQARAVNAETNQYLETDSTGGSYTVAAGDGTGGGGGVTPTPTPTPTPTSTPIPTVSPELPEAGDLGSTLFLLIGGGAMFVLGFIAFLL